MFPAVVVFLFICFCIPFIPSSMYIYDYVENEKPKSSKEIEEFKDSLYALSILSSLSAVPLLYMLFYAVSAFGTGKNSMPIEAWRASTALGTIGVVILIVVTIVFPVWLQNESADRDTKFGMAITLIVIYLSAISGLFTIIGQQYEEMEDIKTRVSNIVKRTKKSKKTSKKN